MSKRCFVVNFIVQDRQSLKAKKDFTAVLKLEPKDKKTLKEIAEVGSPTKAQEDEKNENFPKE